MAPTFKIECKDMNKDWIKPYEIHLREQILLCPLHRLDDIINVPVLKFLWILLKYESTWSLIEIYTETNIFLHFVSVFREWVGLYDFGLPGLVCKWKQKDQNVTRYLFFGCLCLGRVHKSQEIVQETHGLWDFQISDSWIITKNLFLLCNVFDLRLLVCLRSINALASKFCSTHFLFCSAHFLWFHAILDQGLSLWARGTGK